MTVTPLRRVAELEATNRSFAALAALGLQVAAEREPQAMLSRVCSGALALAEAQFAVLCVQGPHGGRAISCTAGLLGPPDRPLPVAPDISHGLLGRVRAARQPQRVMCSGGDPCEVGLPPGYPPLHSALVVPVASQSTGHGWLCLGNKAGAEAFSAEDETLVALLGAQAGRLFEHAELCLQAQQRAEQLQNQVHDHQQTLDAQSASLARLRRAQALTKITHVISRHDGSFESTLDTLPAMLGLAPEAMPQSARDWLALVHPQDRARFRQHALQAAWEGARMDFTYRILRSDGEYLHLRQVMEPLEESMGRGEQGRWFNTIQDVTTEKRAQEEPRKRPPLQRHAGQGRDDFHDARLRRPHHLLQRLPAAAYRLAA